jgi:uncharacterized protein YcaQ
MALISSRVVDIGDMFAPQVDVSEARGKKGRWTERTYDSFDRAIPPPAQVEGDNAKTEFNNGLLRNCARAKGEASKTRVQGFISARILNRQSRMAGI